MKISIVTISFNQARFLQPAIGSVIGQGYPDLDYIIVDPGSSDKSRSIIERYQDWISHVVYEPDDGPADGLNHGFERASGEIYGFLNADDVLLSGSLKAVAAAFKRYPNVDVISGHGWLVTASGELIRRKYSNRFGVWRYLHRGAYLLQQSTFFRAEAFRRVGGFNAANRTCWDGELWLEMALAGCKFKLANEYWSHFRVYDQSITGLVSQDPDFRRRYEQDRNRMFRKATGRDPIGIGYKARCGVAEILKWSSNPIALTTRMISTMDARSRRSPI